MTAPRDTPDRGTDNEPGEQTVAYWHPGMTQATYLRVLRLLFDPQPEAGDGEAATQPGRTHRAA